MDYDRWYELDLCNAVFDYCREECWHGEVGENYPLSVDDEREEHFYHIGYYVD
jgi:hypothetical protein